MDIKNNTSLQINGGFFKNIFHRLPSHTKIVEFFEIFFAIFSTIFGEFFKKYF